MMRPQGLSSHVKWVDEGDPQQGLGLGFQRFATRQAAGHRPPAFLPSFSPPLSLLFLLPCRRPARQMSAGRDMPMPR